MWVSDPRVTVTVHPRVVRAMRRIPRIWEMIGYQKVKGIASYINKTKYFRLRLKDKAERERVLKKT